MVIRSTRWLTYSFLFLFLWLSPQTSSASWKGIINCAASLWRKSQPVDWVHEFNTRVAPQQKLYALTQLVLAKKNFFQLSRHERNGFWVLSKALEATEKVGLYENLQETRASLTEVKDRLSHYIYLDKIRRRVDALGNPIPSSRRLYTALKEFLRDTGWSFLPFCFRVFPLFLNLGDYGRAKIPNWLAQETSKMKMAELGIKVDTDYEFTVNFLIKYLNVYEHKYAESTAGRLFRPLALGMILALTGITPLDAWSRAVGEEKIPVEVFSKKVNQVSTATTPRRTVVLMDGAFRKKILGEVMAPMYDDRNFVLAIEGLIPELKPNKELVLNVVNNSQDISTAMQNLTEKDDRVIFLAHGEPGEMSFGSGNSFANLLNELMRRPAPIVKPDLEVLFVSCSFAHPTHATQNQLNEPWVEMSRFILGPNSRGRAYAVNLPLVASFPIPPEDVDTAMFLDKLQRLSKPFQTAVGATHMRLFQETYENWLNKRKPELLVFHAQTNSVETIPIELEK